MAWQVGDLAVCVRGLERTVEGAIYTVADICPPGQTDADGFVNASGVLNLRFAELSVRIGYWSGADRFRKVVRDKHEACEPEFVTLLKRNRVSA